MAVALVVVEGGDGGEMWLWQRVFSVFSIVTFLCASHKAKKLQSHKKEASAQFGEKKLVSKLQENISSKALLMVKMISWRKGEGEEEFKDEDEAVWKRTIIMGERCRPLDFSGKIVYDSQGNLLPN
ncbi:uncharacterized protein LOC132282154 [Cornus florida]|uniref:uncharacterized protein LOC132282154 n=1 Tax=Cornus florida TaxID=4283 RepID=UPI0028991DEB|nr:uncharacterized protein LOC132282154 [Cornus florida]